MIQNRLEIFPVLETDRLRLRQLQDSDVEQLFALRTDPEVNRYIHRDIAINHDEILAHIEKINKGIGDAKWTYWVICLKEKPELIGTICLWNFSDDRLTAELGYEMRPQFQGRGIMNEALEAVIRFGFEVLDLATIEAFTHEHNEASIHLLRKHQFVLQPERRDADVPANRIFTLQR